MSGDLQRKSLEMGLHFKLSSIDGCRVFYLIGCMVIDKIVKSLKHVTGKIFILVGVKFDMPV